MAWSIYLRIDTSYESTRRPLGAASPCPTRMMGGGGVLSVPCLQAGLLLIGELGWFATGNLFFFPLWAVERWMMDGWGLGGREGVVGKWRFGDWFLFYRDGGSRASSAVRGVVRSNLEALVEEGD